MAGMLFLSKRLRVSFHAVHLSPSRDEITSMQSIGNTHLHCRRTQNEATLRCIFASVHLIEGMAFCSPCALTLTQPAQLSDLDVNILQFPLVVITNQI